MLRINDKAKFPISQVPKGKVPKNLTRPKLQIISAKGAILLTPCMVGPIETLAKKIAMAGFNGMSVIIPD
jgi:hypothetical protein